MKKSFLRFWQGPGGGADVLRIALPLILSTSAFTVQLFVDRVFLMWYASETMSAAMYGGMLNFTIFSLFVGTATYVNTFVAQYEGASQSKRIGPSVWQGIYFSVAAGLVMAGVSLLAEPIVNLAGHDAVLRGHETVYFRILCAGAMPGLIGAALSCFYTGRGKTLTVMWINIAGTIVNITLNYALIFGNWNLPRLGVAGAAWATVISSVFTALIYLIFFLQHKNRQNCATLSGWRFDKELFIRLMRYGLPSGVQFMLDILGFTLFIAFIGRISPLAMAASAIAFQINTIGFLPMIGFSTAVSTLVGQALGKDQPDLAQKSTWTAAILTMVYMTIIAFAYWFVPDILMYPFSMQADPVEFAQLVPVVKKLLCFVAIFCLFDTGNLIFSAALKGAGDTRFVMYASVTLNWTIMVVPSYIAIKLRSGIEGLYWAWAALTAYVCVLAFLFLVRFLGGKWKTMRVIETVSPVLPARLPAVPTVEIDSP